MKLFFLNLILILSWAAHADEKTACERGFSRLAGARSVNRRIQWNLENKHNVEIRQLTPAQRGEVKGNVSVEQQARGEKIILNVDRTELGRARPSDILVHEAVHVKSAEAAAQGRPTELDVSFMSRNVPIGPEGYATRFSADEAKAYHVQSVAVRQAAQTTRNMDGKIYLMNKARDLQEVSEQFRANSLAISEEFLEQFRAGQVESKIYSGSITLSWNSPTMNDRLTVVLKISRSFSPDRLKEYVEEYLGRTQARLRQMRQ